ncbi:MAG: porin family protein [Rhizobiales bacterium]|nr:porin family protein [Hyphomicrobiales bacterium]
MSRIRSFGASLIVLSAGIAPAAAADLGGGYAEPSAPAYRSSGFSWNGPEIGVLLGYGWGNASAPGTKFGADGWTGGAYAGYNFQVAPQFVLGVEGDIMASGMDGSVAGLGVSNPWNATLRGRAGWAYNQFLLYGTGGLALGGLKTSTPGDSDTKTQVGWTLGVGAEAALTNTVTARLEYRYTDLGNAGFSNVGGGNVGFTSNQLMLGLGMKF